MRLVFQLLSSVRYQASKAIVLTDSLCHVKAVDSRITPTAWSLRCGHVIEASRVELNLTH